MNLKGTGKTMLVNAVATATNAFVFNISPRNTAGQYVGKANVTKMIHMVFKVAKANAPAIIYIDGFEMIFAKKVRFIILTISKLRIRCQRQILLIRNVSKRICSRR